MLLQGALQTMNASQNKLPNSEPHCETCKLQDEAAGPGTQFHVGEDLRSVYMITNSGKRLPIIGSVDFIAAQWVRDTLQRAWDDERNAKHCEDCKIGIIRNGQCENGCGAEQSEDAPLAALRDLHRPFGIYDECDHKHEAVDGDVVDVDDIGLTCAKLYDVCRECCLGGNDSQTEECVEGHDHGPGKPICKTAEILAGATVQAEGPVPISADAHDQMLSLLREYMKCEYEGCVTCIERLDHLLRAGGITVG